MTDPTTMADTVPMTLDDIEPHPANPKAHSLDTIMASIRRFGFVEPIVVDQRTGLNVSGHGRVEALTLMRDHGEDPPDGITDDWRAPVYIGWASTDDDEARAALVALNRTGEIGGWDSEALLAVLDQLDTDDALDGLGFDSADVDDLRALLADHDALDDVLDEVGDLDGDEANVTVRLDLPPDLAAAWKAHRDGHDNDADALAELLG